jgi:peptidoglycan-associated lipoprotein
MKTMKLIYPLAFALAITLASTGCHTHQPVAITPIPGNGQTSISDQDNPNTLSNGVPIIPDTGPLTQPNVGPIPVADSGDFDHMTMDRAALAANTVHFAYDSTVVKKSEDSNLQAVAAALSADSSAKLLVEGYCDERGTEEYNRSLGERRALALREALAKMGIDPMRVRTISYGKDKPADPGHDEAAWAKNRRGEFVLLHPKTGV